MYPTGWPAELDESQHHSWRKGTLENVSKQVGKEGQACKRDRGGIARAMNEIPEEGHVMEAKGRDYFGNMREGQLLPGLLRN